MRGLSPKQKLFCEEYIIDLNAYQAAIRAGYAENTANTKAHKWLGKDSFQIYISELQKTRSTRVQITQDDVLKDLMEVRDICMARKVITATYHGEDVERRLIDAKEANHALELLGRHLGMFSDKLNIDGDLNFSIKVDYGDDDES